MLSVQSVQPTASISGISPYLGNAAVSGTQNANRRVQPAAQQVQPTQTSSSSDSGELSQQEQSAVRELKAIDREVKAHEQAHMVAGGRLVTRGATYSYVVGPDGNRYAIGGEVQIDTSEVQDNPQATIQKANQIIRAALAPMEPSTQDRQVAAKARTMQTNAQAEIARQAYQQNNETSTAVSTSFSAAG